MDITMIDWNAIDWNSLARGGKLLIWAGEKIKAWLEAREQTVAPSKKPIARKKKFSNEVAIVVRLSRMNVADVRAYLKAHKIDADLIIVSNTDGDEPIHLPNDPDVWEDMAREFYTVFTTIQAQSGAKKFHIFLSAPAALAFAMGCTMSTLYDVQLYQWDVEKYVYVRVIRSVSRETLMRKAKPKT